MSRLSQTAARPPQQTSLPSDLDASGRSFGPEELAALQAVLEGGTLAGAADGAVRQLESELAATFGSRFAYASSSGTSALHAAVAAVDPEPGDEIVCAPLTQISSLSPILYQGAIPVFADVDPETGNVTAATLRAKISERTRAIVVTHLFGKPCPMDGILQLARAHDLPVIEDCSHAFLATSGHQFVGTLGAIGCFSLEQEMHMTCGEGGFVITDNERFARRMCLFINERWEADAGGADRDFLALDSRLSELQGAVALAQLQKLSAGVVQRIRLAEEMRIQLEGTPGLSLPRTAPGERHTYWRLCLTVDPQEVPGGPHAVAAQLREVGIPSAPGYLRKPAFETQLFQEQRTFGRSRFPFSLARPEALDWSRDGYPGTYQAHSEMLVLPWNERLTCEHVRSIAEALKRSVRHLRDRAQQERGVALASGSAS